MAQLVCGDVDEMGLVAIGDWLAERGFIVVRGSTLVIF